jgi:methylated-DNA-protein-cysteine methyltransferase-like protein
LSPARPSSASDSYPRIYEVVSKIPYGKLATYGQVADLAGLVGHARQVGYALYATPDDLDIPWQRVVNAKGEISARSESGADRVQQVLLEAEGVVFDGRGRVRLKDYRWEPRLQSFVDKANKKKSTKPKGSKP